MRGDRGVAINFRHYSRRNLRDRRQYAISPKYVVINSVSFLLGASAARGEKLQALSCLSKKTIDRVKLTARFRSFTIAAQM